jgi:hypothetical protein
MKFRITAVYGYWLKLVPLRTDGTPTDNEFKLPKHVFENTDGLAVGGTVTLRGFIE